MNSRENTQGLPFSVEHTFSVDSTEDDMKKVISEKISECLKAKESEWSADPDYSRLKDNASQVCIQTMWSRDWKGSFSSKPSTAPLTMRFSAPASQAPLTMRDGDPSWAATGKPSLEVSADDKSRLQLKCEMRDGMVSAYATRGGLEGYIQGINLDFGGARGATISRNA